MKAEDSAQGIFVTRKAKIEKLAHSSNELANSANELLGLFANMTENCDTNFDVKQPIHGTDLNYADCLSRLVTVAEISDKFERSANTSLLSNTRLSALSNAIADTESHLQSLSNQFSQLIVGNGGMQSFNYENFHMQTKNGQSHDLRGYFKNFAVRTDALVDTFFDVLVVLRPSKATYSFLAASNALTTLIEATSQEINELRSENAELSETIAIAKENEESAKTAASEAERLRSESEKERKTIGEYLADATQKRASIETIHSAASELEEEVNEYKSTFSSFDKQLVAREESFEKGKLNQSALFEKFENYKQSIADLITQSEEMLKGATVAGLASSFSEAHEKLGKQLMWARASFYLGILFLFISAIPLMIYVFLPIIGPIVNAIFPEGTILPINAAPENDISGWQYLGQVLARFVILLPAAWFVSFSAIRHSSLFRLREHYAYKYSMAVSVEGFQKQAEGYESEIAALVLEQLAFNPADKLVRSKDVEEGKAPNLILNLLLDKLRTKAR